jgi:hypothetical protein
MATKVTFGRKCWFFVIASIGEPHLPLAGDQHFEEVLDRSVEAPRSFEFDSYRFYFAVYVRQRTWITPFYMSLIDPFRKWIIYPALLKKIRATWNKNIWPNDSS